MIDDLSIMSRNLKARYDKKALRWGANWPDGYDLTAVAQVEEILERLAKPPAVITHAWRRDRLEKVQVPIRFGDAVHDVAMRDRHA